MGSFESLFLRVGQNGISRALPTHRGLQPDQRAKLDSLEILQDELSLIHVARLYGNDRVEGSGPRD